MLTAGPPPDLTLIVGDVGAGGNPWADTGSGLALVWLTIAAGDGLRRSLDRERTGASAWLSAAVAGVSALLVAGLVLGSFGWLHRAPLLAAMAVVAGIAQVGGRHGTRSPASHPAPSPPSTEPTWLSSVAAASVALVVLVWLGGAHKVLTRGVVDVDSHHYHLSHALRFAQTGKILPLHHVWSGDLAAYHPSNDELIRAMGMLVGGSDLTGVVWNAVPIGVGILAAFVFGRSIGRPATAILAAAAALAMPGIALPFAGGAANDLIALCMVLAAVALAWDARTRGSWLLVGAAAGVALGTKLTVLPAVAVLLVTIVALRDPRRLPVQPVALTAGALLTGAFWYARNWAAAGNPVPGLELPGPLRLNEPAAPTLELIAHPVTEYLGNGDIVRQQLLPGLRFAYGPLWLVVLGITVLGIASGISGWRRAERSQRERIALVCAVVAAVTVVAYSLTPTSAGGSDGDPWLFKSNVRYLLPATVLGTLTAVVRLSPRWTPALGAAVAATAATGALAAIEGLFSVQVMVLAGLVSAAAALLWGRRPALPLGPVALLALSVGMIGASGILRERYLDAQYEPLQRMGPLYLAVRDAGPGSRVGVVGLPDQYGYAGRNLQNTVQYIGRETADGGYLAFDTCGGLMAAVRSGGFDFLAVNSGPADVPPAEQRWVGESPAFELLESSDDGGWIYRVTDVPDADHCRTTDAAQS